VKEWSKTLTRRHPENNEEPARKKGTEKKGREIKTLNRSKNKK
jgi:hypothetical protein